MKKVVFFLFMLTISIKSVANDKLPGDYDVPHIKRSENYTTLRTKFIEAGWAPYHAADALYCSQFDERCKGRPEMEACSDVGQGQCAWLWKKGRKIVVVHTISNGDDEIFIDVSRYQDH